MTKTWKHTVQETYSSLEELRDYDETFNVTERCGYSNCQDLWRDNPLIGGSVNPKDFGIAKFNKYSVTGKYRKQNTIGNFQNFSVMNHKAGGCIQAMNQIREKLYGDGYDHIVFETIKENGVEIPMLVALGLE